MGLPYFKWDSLLPQRLFARPLREYGFSLISFSGQRFISSTGNYKNVNCEMLVIGLIDASSKSLLPPSGSVLYRLSSFSPDKMSRELLGPQNYYIYESFIGAGIL